MATVTGITVEKAQEIEDASVVSGHITGTHLFLTTAGGTEIDAGVVVPTVPPIPDPIDSWPIGSVFIANVATNPAILLGGGTWARHGQGRVLVSQDSGQTEFDTIGETGGAKTHTLIPGEIPAHLHAAGTLTSATDGNHNHNFERRNAVGSLSGVARGGGTTEPDGSTNIDGAHSHNITGSTANNTGGGGAHNNLQPYIVVYMWVRTA